VVVLELTNQADMQLAEKEMIQYFLRSLLLVVEVVVALH
jgi:hypothetical protein